ncbi:MAG: hypothetical protein J7M19_08910 [Planctomycetes bacterium]|nr:hypothetical protein [Planctomycetota bacterium]
MGRDEGPGLRHSEEHRVHIPRYQGDERRHTHRHRLTCLEVIYRKLKFLQLLKGRPSQRCPVSNVTSHGVRFYTGVKLRARTVIDVAFEAPTGVYRIATANRLRARIIWQKWSKHHNAFRTGAQFIGISETMHIDLARMMKDAALHSAKF